MPGGNSELLHDSCHLLSPFMEDEPFEQEKPFVHVKHMTTFLATLKRKLADGNNVLLQTKINRNAFG